jgi:hypothetical protein
MSENKGYIYVLANSSMPGLVKVGKTAGDPAERASALSSPTGLPTPFIVVYEQLFLDCGLAESFIHSYLESKGYRISAKREFFNAPVSDIVKAITLAPNPINNEFVNLSSSTNTTENQNSINDQEDLDNLTLDSEPWVSILEEADAFYYGLGDQIQDYDEALKLYRQASKLGSLKAYSRMGGMYESGEGVIENPTTALAYYKEGKEKGSIECIWKMALLFAHNKKALNAEKCFKLFLLKLSTLPVNLSTDDQKLTASDLNLIYNETVYFLCDFIRKEHNLSQFPSFSGFIMMKFKQIYDESYDILDDFKLTRPESLLIPNLQGVIELLNGINPNN